MIITESQIEGVKFEHHKEESLINTVLEEPKEEAKPHFFFFSDFYSIILHYNECMLFIRHD